MENESIIQDLNNILLKISNNTFNINNKDLFLFIYNIQNLFDGFIIFEYLSFENKKNNKFSDDFINIIKKLNNKNLLIKFILLIYFNLVDINSEKYTNINFNIFKSIFNKKYIFQIVKNKIIQLFLSNIFNENDIILLSKILIEINKSIFCFYIIKDIIKNGLNEINNKIILEICTYIINENIQIESKITKYFFYIIDNVELTKENINIIIQILIQKHSFNYDNNIYEYLIKSTLFHFENIGNKYPFNNNNLIISNSLLSLNVKILFLKNLIEKEFDLLLKDEYKIYNGFILENPLTYIKLDKIKELGNKNCCSIIFSFNFKVISNETIYLFDLYNKDSSSSYFTIFIENQYLYFSISKLEKNNIFPKEKEIKIAEKQTYQIIFSMEKGKPNKIIITINGKEYDYTLKYGTNIEYPFTIINSELYICNNCNIDYKIEIGTIFLFDCFFNKKIKNIISNFKGEYENIILNKCNHLFNNKYYLLKQNFDFIELKKFKLNNKLKGMITPKSISFRINNNNFKENYYDLKNLRIYNRNLFINGNLNYFINLSLSIYNFIYFNGLKFLQLNCEFYLQILNNENIEKDYETINLNLLHLIQFLNILIKNDNNDLLYFENCFLLFDKNIINNSFIDLSNEEMEIESNELFFTYSSICQLIQILKGDKTLIIDEFINVIPLLNNKKKTKFISSLLYKIINFLLKKEIYNEQTKRILPCVYLKIVNCFENSSVDLISKFYLEKLINMNDDSIEFNKLFDVFLSKIILNYENELININNTLKNSKINLIYFLMKIIILKLKKFPITVLDLKVISNILMLLYKNLSNIKSNDDKNNIEKIKKEENNNIKRNESIKENQLNKDNIYKGFILSGLKAFQNSNSQTEEYFNIVDKIKAIFIQFINLINNFDTIFFETLINLQKLDNLKGNYIFINGKKSFLSFYCLLFSKIKYDVFTIIISKEIFKPIEYKLNLQFFKKKFGFLLNLVQNFSKDEIIKLNVNNEKILFYMRENIFSLIINIIYQFSSSKTDLNTKKVIEEIFHEKDNLLIQYYLNYRILNDEMTKIFFSELISISKTLIYNDNHLFIFDLFFKLFIKFQKNTSNEIQKIIPEIFMKLSYDFNLNLSNKNEINENNIIIRNYIQLIILFYKLISQIKILNLDDKDDINNQFVQNFVLNSFLFSNNPFLYKSIKYNIGNNNFKYFQEIIIEIFIELYLLTKKNNYIIFIKNNVLKQPYNKYSYFYEYDKKYIETENENKNFFFNFFYKNENKQPRKLLTIHYYIKFTIYSLNTKNDDLKSLYEEINKSLKENILSLFSKKELIKKKINLINFEEDNLYKKVFQYFYYEKYKMSNKENDLSNYIQKKIKKQKYYNSYIKYFKISYGKNGEVIDNKNKDINLAPNKTILEVKNDKDINCKSYSPSDNNLLNINNEKLNLSHIYDIEIDKYIKDFNNEIFSKNSNENNNFNNNCKLHFPILNPRKIFCKIIFGKFFKKLLFYNECFLNLRKNYLKKFYYHQINNTNFDTFLTYPSRLKNFSSQKNYIKIFLKPNFNFFDNKYYSISHKNINLDFKINEFSNNLSLFENRIQINFNNLNANIFECELITIGYIIQGKIYLSNYYFIFQSNSFDLIKQNKDMNKINLNKIFSSCKNDINITKDKILYFRYEQIKQIFIKRFLYQFQSIEIFLLNGKSYFFNLFNISNKDNLISILQTKNIDIIFNLKEHFNKNLYTKNYLDNKISTFDYLLYINFYSSRSLNDLNQYFVFPWLTIKKEKNSKIELRNFKYPLSVQNKEKKEELIIKYNNLKKEYPNKKFINHHNSHYSTSSFVNFYLIRISPFNENIIQLQNGKYDNPNRIFYSISHVINVIIQYNDNRELIPEFFYLSESYLNLNYNNYGIQEQNYNINNIVFDDYFDGLKINIKSPFEFMIRYKRLLNSNLVNKYIHFWIDNIFGINQLNDKIESCNLFSKYCYSELVNLNKKIEKYKNKLNDKEIYSKIRDKCDFILNFGQTPMKLFDEKVKEKKILDKSNLFSHNKKLYNNNLFNTINQDSIIFFTFDSYNNNLFIVSENDYLNGILLTVYFNINNISLNNNSEKNKNFDLSIKITDLSKFNLKNKNDKIIYNLKNTFAYLKYSEKNEFIIFINKKYNSIIFHSIEKKKYNFMVPSIACSVISISNKEIITGHIDGIIIHWLIETVFDKNQLIFKKKTFISNQPILSISYNNDYQIILIGNNKDCSINILKLYNFELISVIYLNNLKLKIHNYLIIDQQINRFNNFVYILSYQLDKFILHCFTVNGIKICEELKNICNNFYILDNGNILTYSYTEKSFIFCKGENLNKIIYNKKINIEKEIIYFEFNKIENCIYYIYKEFNNRKINYLYLTNNDINHIYKEENFFECKKEVKKDIWNISDDEEL